ncbi:hypothetical protein ACQRAF_13025 [Lachnospiraceae bacterium SGI.240]
MKQEKVGSFLKELRKEKNITQEQLAESMRLMARFGLSRKNMGS